MLGVCTHPDEHRDHDENWAPEQADESRADRDRLANARCDLCRALRRHLKGEERSKEGAAAFAQRLDAGTAAERQGIPNRRAISACPSSWSTTVPNTARINEVLLMIPPTSVPARRSRSARNAINKKKVA